MGVVALVGVVADQGDQSGGECVGQPHRVADELDAHERAVVQVGQDGDRLAGERRGQVRDRDGVAGDPDVGGLPEPVPGGEAGGPGQPEPGLDRPADERAAAYHAVALWTGKR